MTFSEARDQALIARNAHWQALNATKIEQRAIADSLGLCWSAWRKVVLSAGTEAYFDVMQKEGF